MYGTERLRRRTPRLPAFGAFSLGLILLCAGSLWAQPARFKTVTVGPLRAIATAAGIKLQPQQAVADRVVVRLQPGVQMQAAQDLLARVKGRYRRHVGLGMYVVDLPAGSDVVSAAAALRQQLGVLDAQPDLIVYPALVPNDPNYSSQYHLPLIQAPAAWNVVTGVGSNVVIAVVDSGVDLDHPDLAARIWQNTADPVGGGDQDGNGYVDDYRGWDFYDDNNDPNPSPQAGSPNAEVNHGTMVAGIAAATGNEGYGTAGITWGAKIMALQVFPNDGGTAISTVVDGINYAVAKGAKVINLSIGGGYSSLFTPPIAAAYNAGVLVVSAGGNSGKQLTDVTSTWDSPVCNDGQEGPPYVHNYVLAVGATDRYDRKASWSNWDGSTGSFIEICAPGVGIYAPTAYFPAFPGFNTYFGTNDGTSFSCPIVSGAAALLLAQTPSLTPAQLIAAIRSNGDNIDPLNPGYAGQLGGGRLDVARAAGVTLAPAAPLNLAAVDTPGDNGGSVTLSWLKSPDDSAGTGSVTAYLVSRKTTGAFALLNTLAAGSTAYVDATTTDGVDYYYKVGASDGTLVGEAGPVGPMQSRNDSAPALVANVRAADRPSDTGGAMVVAWDPYTPPADFGLFALYRSTHSFTSTVGMTPLTTIAASGTVTYTDLSAVDGTDYYYAVGARDTAANEVRSLTSYGPVQSYSNGAVNLSVGLHFMGMPVIPPGGDPATLFGLAPGSFAFARWSPEASGYWSDNGTRPLPDVLQLGLGRGYWVKLNQAISFSPAGASAPAGDFDINLTAGSAPAWHQIGNPFLAPLKLTDATVTYNSATMDLITADGQGIVAAFAWGYDSAAGAYTLVYPPLQGQTLQVPPWQGFWVLAYKSCVLTLARPAALQSAPAAVASRPQAASAGAAKWSVDWSVALRVRSGAAADSECYVGAASRQILAPKPPPAADTPVLSLAAPGDQGDGNYAVSLAQSAQTNIIWNVRVQNLRAGQPVSLSTPDLSRLPARSVAILEDRATGQTAYLRTVAQYTFTPRSGETERSFRLSVAPPGVQSLAIQSLVAQAVSGRGAQVSFTLSSAAACSATVLNMAGRTVRVVEEGKLRPAGNNTLLWDGRNQTGSAAPPGMYLLQVKAEGPSGESVRALSPLRMQ